MEQPTDPRYVVVSAEVEHPSRPGIAGQVVRWPTGIYTLLATNGHTHYSLPQAWAAAQTVLTPVPEVAP